MINDIRKRLIELIEVKRQDSSSRFSQIKWLTIGDPYTFANSELPAVAIVANDGNIRARGTEYDTHARSLTIVIVQSIKDTLGANDPGRVEWDYRLADLVEGSIDDSADCIVGFLRSNYSLLVSWDTQSKATLEGDISWRYAPSQRWEDAFHECRISLTYSLTSWR